jgi:P4 family phage/plasmid primase-like protien
MNIISNWDVNGNSREEGQSPLRRAHAWWFGQQGREQPTQEDNVEQIAEWLRILVEEGQVVELRAIKVEGYGTSRWTWSGFFDTDHIDELAEAALQLTGRAEGVYFTLNPVNPELLARRCNKVDRAQEGDAACDLDVLKRRWLLIDADPQRVSGVSSTDAEREKAWEVVDRVRKELTTNGWPAPVVADSGNGYHLLYRIDLPADDQGLVKRVLTALAARFDTNQVKIDQKVYNPGRIVKLYGTLARKGSNMPERPHRTSQVLDVPEEVEPVAQELLEALAAEVPDQPARQNITQARTSFGVYSFQREEVKRRARLYLDKVPPAVSGQGGHNQTFRAACVLVQGFNLSAEEAMPLLKEWNESCQPPWAGKELLHKLRSAEKQPGERGRLLAERNGWSGVTGPMGPEATAESRVDGEALKEIDDPYRLARLYVKESGTVDGALTLRYWKEQWWRWSEGSYRLLGTEELRARVWTHIEDEFQRANIKQLKDRSALQELGQVPRGHAPTAQKVTNALVSNVLGALASLCLVSGDIEQPAWLLGQGESEQRSYVGMKNGLLRLDDLLEGKKEVLEAHSPAWFSRVCLTYHFDPDADCPKWKAFLDRNLEGDQERIALLQEWFGYCLTADTSQQRFLMLWGEGSNGKSVVCAALTAVLGDGNVSHVPLENFGERFALAGTLGKLANIASEVGEIDKVAEGQLKQFTSGDRMTFDRKGIAPVEAMPTARLVLATNNLPRFSDRSGGIWRRLLLLPFQVEIGADERVPGMDKPAWWVASGELPGIFNWAVEGLRRLNKQGRFTEAKLSQEALEQHRTDCNSARAFLKENCFEATTAVATERLYERYQEWCKRNGYQSFGEKTFGKEVVRVFPKVRKRKLGSRTGRQNFYQGLAINNPPDQLLPAIVPGPAPEGNPACPMSVPSVS